jgi:uncharacterized membrane protein
VDPTAYNAWRFASLSPFPVWALVALALTGATAVVLAWRGLRSESRPARRWALTGLRALSALVVLFLLLEPAVRLLQTARVKNRLAILVDRSRSMNFPVEPGGAPRATVAADWVAEHRSDLQTLAGRVNVEWYAFDKELGPGDPVALSRAAPANGPRTDLLAALKSVAGGGSTSGRRIAGVLAISDGADNASLAEGLSPAARAELRSLGFPVSALAVGSGSPKDLAVERVAVDDFAFVRNSVTVEATLSVHGFSSEEVVVVLRREGAVVAQRTVKLEPGKERYTVPLTFAPDTTGTFVFTVTAPVYPGEASAENNSRSFVLRVIRDRVRVLLVAGRPCWDERFLRSLLKQDPNIDLVSFFILRTAGDNSGPQSELSLIPFPVPEIFGSQLRTFDAVIFVDFDYRPYRSLDIEHYLPGIRDYVRGGGAFAMLGGEQSFAEGRYGGTPISEILPVEMPDGMGISTELLKPRLTAEGRSHPVTRLVAGDGPNDAAWNALPPIPGLNLTYTLGPEQGARVLLEAPSVLVRGRPAPVVAVREVGAGRTLAVTTDSSWYWGFAAAEEGAGTRSYQRFWNNALRWLVRDPDLTPLQVQPDRPTIEPGEIAALSITARGRDYGPAAGARVAAELRADDGKTVARAEGLASADGTVHLELAPPGPGAYKVVASAERTGAPADTASTALVVRSSGPEDADAAPRPELLRAVADTTGGTFATLPRRGMPEIPLADPEVVEVGQRKDVPIWPRWWYLVALSLTLGAEWILRRRWGYW